MQNGRTILCLAVVCLPVLAADNPFLGTWKQNVEKSMYSDRATTENAEIRIEASGNHRVKITQTFIDGAGKKTQMTEETPLDGTETHPADASGPNANFTRSFRSVAPKVWERTAKLPDEVRRGYWAISNDGKLLVITGFGKTSAGKEYYFHRIFDRQ